MSTLSYSAIMTERAKIPPELKEKYALLVGKYL